MTTTSALRMLAHRQPLARLLATVDTAVERLAGVVLAVLECGPRAAARLRYALPVLVMATGAAMLGTGACAPWDWQCKIDAWNEGWLEGLSATFAGLTESMIQGIFTGNLGSIGVGGWNAGIGTANKIGAVMAIVVVGLCGLQIIATLVAGQRAGILRAVVGALLAWPTCVAAIWVSIRLVGVVDGLASAMIDDSSVATLSQLVDLAWLGSMVSGNPATVALVTLLFVFGVFIPTLGLSIVMAFRNYALVMAVAVAPVSLMVWGMAALRGMARGWTKVTVALILTKPVMAIALVVAAQMITEGVSHIELGAFLTGVAGIVLACFSPFAAMGMVSAGMAVADGNIMRGAEQGLGRLARGVGGGARTVARAVAPAGVGGLASKGGDLAGRANAFLNNVGSHDGGGADPEQPPNPAPPQQPAPAQPPPSAPGPVDPVSGPSTSEPPEPRGQQLSRPASDGADRVTGPPPGTSGDPGQRALGSVASAAGQAGRVAGEAVGTVVAPGSGTLIGGEAGERLGSMASSRIHTAPELDPTGKN